MALRNCELIAFAATARPQEARHFYRDVLGLELIQETPAAQVFDAHGTMLRISQVAAMTAAAYTVLGWKVADLRTTAAQLRGRGVRFERYPQMAQDDAGIWTSPQGDLVAWFRDPDGNLLSLTQFKAGASAASID